MLMQTSINVGKTLEGCALFGSGLTLGATFYITAIEIPGRRGAAAGYQLQNYHRIFPRAMGLLKRYLILLRIFPLTRLVLEGYLLNFLRAVEN